MYLEAKYSMNEKPKNPDWKDLIAPFGWLLTRILFRLFRRRWNADPRIPYNMHKLPEEEQDP